jgi:hypothetical protein
MYELVKSAILKCGRFMHHLKKYGEAANVLITNHAAIQPFFQKILNETYLLFANERIIFSSLVQHDYAVFNFQASVLNCTVRIATIFNNLSTKNFNHIIDKAFSIYNRKVRC